MRVKRAAISTSVFSTPAGIDGEREVKELVLALLRLKPGLTVLDLGCGTGEDAPRGAELIGPSDRVVGVDHSAAMVEGARRRAAGASLPVQFVGGDAYELAYPVGSFDRARADPVFVHLQDPSRGLAEMVRVIEPGERVLITDVDSRTFWLDSDYQQTTRTVLDSRTDALGSGWVGRSLPRMFQQAGQLGFGSVPRMVRCNLAFYKNVAGGHVSSLGVAALVTRAELDAWWQDLASAEAAGRWVFGFGALTVVGRKP